MKNNGCFGELSWNNEDIENALDCCNREITKENVKLIREKLDNHFFVDYMIERGWEYIYGVIEQHIKETE